MELKAYQQRTLSQLRDYLHALRGVQPKRMQARALDTPYEWDVDAWRQVSARRYEPRKNGAGDLVPTACFIAFPGSLCRRVARRHQRSVCTPTVD